MAHRNIITANSEDEVWKIIADQLNNKKDDRDYSAQFPFENHEITLDIDIHPDRGEENDKPVTSLSAPLPEDTSFRFNIEAQAFKHDIGKLFGMQDVVIGNREFDKKYLIQSNDVDKLKEIFSESELPVQLLQHPVVNFKIRERKIGVNEEILLVIYLDGGITEPSELKAVYNAFKTVLFRL